MPIITGHHHISMIVKNAQENATFFRDILGMRLVKKTVNQDDPSMYHLFYGDKTGSPGTGLTFFEMKNAGRTHRGSNAITRIALLVEDEASIHYFKERFTQYNVVHEEVTSYRGQVALPFTDPDGLDYVLMTKGEGNTPSMWEKWEGSAVPLSYQILGMGPVEMTVRRPKKLANVLMNIFNYERIEESDDMAVYRSVIDDPSSEIIAKVSDEKNERPGRGSVHHLAIRVNDEAEMTYWENLVKEHGYRTTGIIDRHYFHSFYFREGNGIMFELATDGPGLHIDEDPARLGEKLTLPPFLEDKRSEIEGKLDPIQ
ncbi:MAG TPA: ring-cleaving dioxygenase [Pseudogracilibacillus sp.]|nr:ring-cleaving dioxygenase [Pseudogracilibacillus sp.]